MSESTKDTFKATRRWRMYATVVLVVGHTRVCCVYTTCVSTAEHGGQDTRKSLCGISRNTEGGAPTLSTRPCDNYEDKS